MAETLLTEFSYTADANWWTVTNGLDDDIAMGFQIGTTNGSVTKVVTRMAGLGTNATGIRLRIETNNAGVPSGTLAHANLTKDLAAITDTGFADRTFTFASVGSLTGTTQYYLVMQCEVLGGDSVRWASQNGTTATYPDGNTFRKESGAWVSKSDYDSDFEVYGDVAVGGQEGILNLNSKYWGGNA